MNHLLETLMSDDYPSPQPWYGLCECHNPDGDGVGRADFWGDTPQDVVDLHWEHAIAHLEGADQ